MSPGIERIDVSPGIEPVPGIDAELSLDLIDEQEKVPAFIAELEESLRNKMYDLYNLPASAGWTKARALR